MRLRPSLGASLVAFIAAGGLVSTAPAYDMLRTSKGGVLKWQRFPVSYILSASGTNLFTIPGDPPEITATQAFASFREEVQNWQDVTTSKAEFRESSLSPDFTGRYVVDVDGLNVITFASSDPDFYALYPPGSYVGVTVPTYEDDQAPVGAESYFSDVDILFDDFFYVFILGEPTGSTGPFSVNFAYVAAHEFGHFIGAAHSFVRTPMTAPIPGNLNAQNIAGFDPETIDDNVLMFPYIDFTPKTSSFIEHDDAIAISPQYPEPILGTDYGTVAGRVYDLATNGSIFGAQVVLLRVDDAEFNIELALQHPVVAAYSLRDGVYRIQGVPAGDYLVLAENITSGNLGAFHNDPANPVDVEFPPTFHPWNRTIQDAGIVSVLPGQTLSAIDIGVLKEFNVEDEFEPNGRPDIASEIPVGGPALLATIDPEGDLDGFRFFANRGDLIRIEVRAGRIQSRLDPVLRVYDGLDIRGLEFPMFEGVSPIRVEDNTLGIEPDALIDLRVPHTGAFYVTVTDKNGNGGPDYWYELTLTLLSREIPLHPLSPRTAVVGVDLSAQSTVGSRDHIVRLKSLKVRFESRDAEGISYNPGDPNVRDMFLPPTRDTNSGVAVYDNKGIGREQFEWKPENPGASDRFVVPVRTPIVVQEAVNKIDVTFEFDESTVIPFQNDGGEIDYWVVVRTSLDLFQGDNFQAVIPPGGIVLDNRTTGQRDIAVYGETVPTYPNTFLGDIVRLVNFTDPQQRIDALSPATAVIGVNILGARSQDYFIREVALTVVGFSGKQLAREPSASFINPELAVFPELFNIPEGTLNEDLSRDDFQPLQVNGAGGFGVYWDSFDPVGRDGLFDPRVDIAIPLAEGDFEQGRLGPRYQEIPSYEVPETFIRRLLPDFAEQAMPAEIVNQLPITAFKVILPLEVSDDTIGMLQVPDTDSASFQTQGADYFIVIRTSALMRALDTFVPMILVGDLTIQSGLNLPEAQRPLPVASGATIDPLSANGTNQLLARPQPFFTYTDLVGAGQSLGTLQQEGAPPLPVIGINATDRGQNMFNFYLNTITFNAQSAMRYFNSSPVLDSFQVRLVPDEDTVRLPSRLLREVSPEFNLDNPRGEPANGLWFVVDDDTSIGDGIDNDGDGLVDEEVLNLQDDDLDGLIDEDCGDVDGTLTGSGGNGVFDGFDDYWPPPYEDSNNPNLMYTFVQDVQFFPTAGNPLTNVPPVNPLTGALTYNIPMEGTIIGETGPANDFFPGIGVPPQFQPYPGLAADPHTLFPFLFVRTDQRPLFYVNQVPAVSNTGAWGYAYGVATSWQHGVYLTVGEIPDEIADFPAQITYNFKKEIPDDDRGPLQGDDFFLVLRAGLQARLGDVFRVVLSRIRFSTYQDIQPGLALSFPGSVTPEFTSGPIRVGRGTFPPTFQFIAPETGKQNRVDTQNRFLVRWNADDPDSTAWISLYLDEDSRDFDGILIKENLNEDTDKSYLLDFNILVPQLRLDPRIAYYVYARIDDGVNEPFAVYSDAPIFLQQPIRTSFGYIKLRDNGQVYVLYELDELSGRDDPSQDRFRRFPAPITGMGQDVEATFASDGILILNENGSVSGYGDLFKYFPNSIVWTATNSIEGFPLHGGGFNPDYYLSAVDDKAVDLAVDWARGAYYVLNQNHGAISAFWVRDPTGEQIPTSQWPPLARALPEWDRMRASGSVTSATFVDMELTPDGDGLYILGQDGRVYAVGSADANLARQAAVIGGPEVVDLDVSSSGQGLAVMSSLGDLHFTGDAPALTDAERMRYMSFMVDDFRDTAKSVKMLSGDGGLRGYIGMSRSGRVTVEPQNLVRLPLDRTIFKNAMEDIEPSAISNLTTIATAVVELYEAIKREDLNAVLGMTSLRYRDDHGNDYNQFRKSLGLFFDAFEIDNWSVGPYLQDISFLQQEIEAGDFVGLATDFVRNRIEVTFKNERIIANVQTTFLMRLPTMYIISLPDDSDGIETFGYPFEEDPLDPSGVPYTQVNEFREVRDGRGWTMEIIDIEDVGNTGVESAADLDGIEAQDNGAAFNFIRRRNEIIFVAAFDEGIDGPWRKTFRSHGPKKIDWYLLVFRRYRESQIYEPPQLEWIAFDTDAVWFSAGLLDAVGSYEATHEFQWEAGQLKLTKFDLDQVMLGPMEEPVGIFGAGEGVEAVENPYGFSTKQRGPTKNRFIGDVSFRIEGGSLLVDCIGGGITNLTLRPYFNPPITSATLDPTPDDLELTHADRIEIAHLIRTRMVLNDLKDTAIPPYAMDYSTALPGDIFMVLDCDGDHYALLRVVAMNPSDEILIFDWYVFPEFTLSPPIAGP